jgi:hypothetical protein
MLYMYRFDETSGTSKPFFYAGIIESADLLYPGVYSDMVTYKVYTKDGALYKQTSGGGWVIAEMQSKYVYDSGGLVKEVIEKVDFSGMTFDEDEVYSEDDYFEYSLNGSPISKAEYEKRVVPPESGTLILSDANLGMTLDEAIEYLGYLVDATYNDTPTNQWYTKYVKWAAENAVVTGYPDDTFRPNNTMTRAEFVQVLYSLAGKPAVAATTAFTDVAAGDWYVKAVSWAVSTGITSGVGGGEFAPGGSVTREQAVAFLYKYAKLKGDNADYSGVALTFGDKADISDWAIPAVQWSAANKIVGGYPDGTFGPRNTATRAEVVTILYGYIN